jgi:hypothetical protein
MCEARGERHPEKYPKRLQLEAHLIDTHWVEIEGYRNRVELNTRHAALHMPRGVTAPGEILTTRGRPHYHEGSRR